MKTVSKWCEIFGVEMIDNDGFGRDKDINTHHVSFEDFVRGICECTINPIDNDRYNVLDFLIRNV